MKSKVSYHFYALLTIVLWSLAFIFTRLALRHFSPPSLGFARYLTASCALVVVAVVRKIRIPAPKDWWLFIASGAFGFALYVTAFNKGAETVTAATCAVVLATGPVLTALFARIFFGERLTSLQWIAVVVEFAGVLVLTLMNGVFNMDKGILWLLAAAVSVGFFNLLQRRLTQSYSGLATSIYGIFAGTVMLGVFAGDALREAMTAPAAYLGYVAILGVFCGAVAYVSWAQAFERAPDTSSVSNYTFLSPLFTTVFGFLMIDELPDLATVVGGVIILAGVALFNRGKSKPETARA